MRNLAIAACLGLAVTVLPLTRELCEAYRELDMLLPPDADTDLRADDLRCYLFT